MDNNFLAINKDYLNYDLKSIDILIIAQIEEFDRNKNFCHLSNQQFAEMFGESKSTIKRTIDKLEKLNIIKRQTTFIKNNGRGNKQRILSLNNRSKWKVQNESTIHNGKSIMNPPSKMEGSNVDNGRFKNAQWKVQNEPIKDNIKDNIKNNIYIKFFKRNEDGSCLYDDVVESYNNNLDMDYDDWAKEIAIDMECNIEDINAIIDDYITT